MILNGLGVQWTTDRMDTTRLVLLPPLKPTFHPWTYPETSESLVGPLEEKVTTPLWDFEGISPERRELLRVHFDFRELADRIKHEARNIRFKKEPGTHEAKGSWRPIFWFDVANCTFDRFFNSPYGYRAQYLADPENGKKQNAELIVALAEVLIASVHGEPQFLQQIRLSLASPHAKIWIEEDQHNPRTPELIIEIRVPEWEKAARAIHARLRAGDSSLKPKEVDRIFGVRAPVGTTLKVMGAWVGRDGQLGVVPSKLQRAEDIKAYGLS